MFISADWSGMEGYCGAVQGFIDGVDSPSFEGNFTKHLANTIQAHFFPEAISANVKGTANIAHVFEWGPQDARGVSTGEPSTYPLFMLNKGMTGSTTTLGYEFLPSRHPVPLPDPERYGFKADKITHMRRHTFQLKAIIMETQQSVTVSPVGAKKLFIPSETNKRGYVMTSQTVNLNPGGTAATGGFAKYWNWWFANRAPDIMQEEIEATENWLVLTGGKYVRYAAGTKIGGKSAGGQFARGKPFSMSNVNAKARQVKARILADAEEHFDESKWESTWDDD